MLPFSAPKDSRIITTLLIFTGNGFCLNSAFLCFLVKSFYLLEDEEAGTDRSTRLAARAMVFDPLGESRRREIKRRNSRRKKYKEEKEIVECPKENAVSSIEEEEKDGSNDRRWPSFEDEEYIVFSFRKDGAIHMIKERKPSEVSENQLTDQKVFCNHHDIVSTSEEDNTTTTPLYKLVSLFICPSFYPWSIVNL